MGRRFDSTRSCVWRVSEDLAEPEGASTKSSRPNEEGASVGSPERELKKNAGSVSKEFLKCQRRFAFETCGTQNTPLRVELPQVRLIDTRAPREAVELALTPKRDPSISRYRLCLADKISSVPQRKSVENGNVLFDRVYE